MNERLPRDASCEDANYKELKTLTGAGHASAFKIVQSVSCHTEIQVIDI